MAQRIPLPKNLKDLCTPAMIYFVLSVVSIVVMVFQNLGNTNTYCLGSYSCNVSSTMLIFVLKFAYVLFFTWLLDLICKAGYNSISWIILLLPFIVFFTLIIWLVMSGNTIVL
jgi:hypothetical protein